MFLFLLKMCYKLLVNCRSVEIGNRTRLKIARRKAWEFESPLRHTQMKKNLVIAVVGPTAAGKSAFAVEMARDLKDKGIGVEIISADSRQVYKGLDIGSGKITKREMRGIPHHLLDVVNPKKVFTVSDFVSQSKKAMGEIYNRGNIPIVVGGTGFYIDALLRGIEIPEVSPNLALRKKLEKKSLVELFKILKKLDGRRAKEIDVKNPARLIRAIEIANALGKVPKKKQKSDYDVLWFGLTASREILKEKIEKRLKSRLSLGMLREVKNLHEKQKVSWKRLESLGLEYRYCALYLQNKLSRTEFESLLALKIFQYAKRQETWFKRYKDIEWI